jgi:hypothetical protein
LTGSDDAFDLLDVENDLPTTEIDIEVQRVFSRQLTKTNSTDANRRCGLF